MINQIIEKVKRHNPLVHCITNPISINQCANLILGVGASPIMAEHPAEVAEITLSADSLLLNFGNITEVRIKSMQIAAATAAEKGIPIVIDVVGVACSGLRRRLALKLIEKYRPAIIKGNYSEIVALQNPEYYSAGVDAEKLGDISGIGAKLAEKNGAVVLASGKIDIITNGKRVTRIKNGCEKLSKVTGTGCMLGALCATYLSAAAGTEAAVAACAVLGVCGELAETEKGNGSFMISLLDNLSTLTNVEKYLKMEEQILEEI
ncbi:MAG: hydroxyethylthiazole kinase [Clostridia bacterium]|nr:hydroxyethylthiazole kinase [Clostridia bacterium]